MKTAIVIGATGLVGRQLVKQLIGDDFFSKVRIFVRRPTNIISKKLEEHIIDFDNLNEIRREITGDILFSCMGTTLKQAGSKSAQYRIDFTYQYEFAKLASDNSVKEYMLVSSTGANPSSRVFYSRMKGELEEAVKNLSFSRTTIIQPSVLSGDREVKRTVERIGAIIINGISKVFPFTKKYRSITGEEVAEAMIAFSKKDKDKRLEIYKLDELFLDK